ncbi:YesL family protein [Paenibacillus yanchengensis]|uniref:YesL family protein n=1 Tax=Paenibacillus yanchengensis TaxID=2035833 RepID=A0ABW4YNH1_9BACL
MEPRGIMGGFYRISEWIMRLSAINLLWIICSFPFALAALGLIVPIEGTEQQILDNMKFVSMVMGIVAPFTLFPATSAMFTVARKWVQGEVDVPLFKTFFRGYKENYKQSMIGGIIYTLLIFIMIVDFIVYKEKLALLAYVFIAFLVLIFISLFNFFSVIVHFEIKTFQLLKRSILFTIGTPLRSLSTAIMCGFVIYLSFFKFQFLIPFFMGSIVAFLAFWNFNLAYAKVAEKAEKYAKLAEEDDDIVEIDPDDVIKDEYEQENSVKSLPEETRKEDDKHDFNK